MRKVILLLSVTTILLVVSAVFPTTVSFLASQWFFQETIAIAQEEAPKPPESLSEFDSLSNEAETLREKISDLAVGKSKAESDLALLRASVASGDVNKNELVKKEEQIRYYSSRLDVAKARLLKVQAALQRSELDDLAGKTDVKSIRSGKPSIDRVSKRKVSPMRPKKPVSKTETQPPVSATGEKPSVAADSKDKSSESKDQRGRMLTEIKGKMKLAEDEAREKEEKKKEETAGDPRKDKKDDKSHKEKPKSRKKAVRDKVKELRKREQAKFGNIIDDGYFRENITEAKYIEKEEFLAKDVKELKDCFDRTLQVYTDALVSKERISLAVRKRAQAFRELLPEVQFEFRDRHGSQTGNAWWGDDYKMTFKQPCFRGGELWFTFLQEDANVRVARAEYDQVVSDLFLDLGKAYFELMRSRYTEKAREHVYEHAEEAWDITRKKWKAGLISEIEYLNVESLYDEARHGLETAEQDKALAVLELQSFLKLEIDEPVGISHYFDYNQELDIDAFNSDWIAPLDGDMVSMGGITDENLDDFIKLAYENRPSLKVELERLNAARNEKNAARGGWLPQVDLTLDFGELGESYKDRNAIFLAKLKHNRQFHLFLEMSWNVGGTTFKYKYDNNQQAPNITEYDGGAGKTTKSSTFTASFFDDLEQFVNTKEARVTELEQIVELEEVEREIIRDVKESYFNFHKAYVKLKSALKRIKYKRKMADLSKHRLDLNEIEISEYLESETEHTEELSELYGAIADFYNAKLSFNRSIGIHDYLPMRYFSKQLGGGTYTSLGQGGEVNDGGTRG